MALALPVAWPDGRADAVLDGLGRGVGHTFARPVSRLTMSRASAGDSAGMPEDSCSVASSGSEATVMSLVSETRFMVRPGTSACTPRNTATLPSCAAT